MTMTVTLDVSHSETSLNTEETIHFKLSYETANSIAQKMLRSNVFTSGSKQLIESIASLNSSDQTVDALCYMLFYILHPAINSTEDESHLELMLEFEDEIKKLLSSNLPQGLDVDLYFKNWSYEQAQVERLALIEKVYQMQVGLLQGSFNVINQKIESSFELLKKKIQQVLQQKQKSHSDSSSEVDELFRQLQNLLDEANSMIINADSLNDRLIEQQKEMQKSTKKGIDQL